MLNVEKPSIVPHPFGVHIRGHMENFNIYENKECREVISHSSYVAGRLYDVPQGPLLPGIHIFG